MNRSLLFWPFRICSLFYSAKARVLPKITFHRPGLLIRACAINNACNTARKFLFMYSFSGNCTASVHNTIPHSCVFERLIYSQDRATYFPGAEEADRSWKYINLSRIYECRNWETENYNSVLEITVSLLGIAKCEPDIFIGFSLAFHLQ